MFKFHLQAHRFLSAHDQTKLIFRLRRYQITATPYHHARNDAFSLWADYTAEMAELDSLCPPFTIDPQQLGNTRECHSVICEIGAGQKS